jgi:hypothetical protein
VVLVASLGGETMLCSADFKELMDSSPALFCVFEEFRTVEFLMIGCHP